MILWRIRKKTEEILSEAQAGFRRGRSKSSLGQLAEKYEEFGKQLYVCYIDFRTAFDTAWRQGLWKVTRHLGYLEKMVRILKNAYKEIQCCENRQGSDWLATIVGILQSCVLSPLLFNIFSGVIMALAMEGSEAGAVMNGEIIVNLRFADGIATLAEKKRSTGFCKQYIQGRKASGTGYKHW